MVLKKERGEEMREIINKLKQAKTDGSFYGGTGYDTDRVNDIIKEYENDTTCEDLQKAIKSLKEVTHELEDWVESHFATQEMTEKNSKLYNEQRETINRALDIIRADRGKQTETAESTLKTALCGK